LFIWPPQPGRTRVEPRSHNLVQQYCFLGLNCCYRIRMSCLSSYFSSNLHWYKIVFAQCISSKVLKFRKWKQSQVQPYTIFMLLHIYVENQLCFVTCAMRSTADIQLKQDDNLNYKPILNQLLVKGQSCYCLYSLINIIIFLE